MLAREDERQVIIAAMRREATERAIAERSVATVSLGLQPDPPFRSPESPPPHIAPTEAATTAPPAQAIPGAPSTGTRGGSPRRSTPQVLLLTAGVVLVSVFAVFFAVLAYVVASVEFRSILTAAASVVVLGVASLLRTKRLVGTAEAMAVIGVVLLLLDIWIIRLNGLFSVDRLDVWLYTGIAFGILAAALLGVSRLTGLRATSVAAAVVASAGVFALVVGVSAPAAADGTRALLGAIAATLVVAVELITPLPAAERNVLRVSSLVAGTAALTAADSAFPSFAAGSSVACGLAVAAWALILFCVHRSHRSAAGPAWRVVAAIGLALAVCGLALSTAQVLGSTVTEAGAWRPTLSALEAVVLVIVARACTPPVRRTLGLVTTIVAAVGILTLLPPISRILGSLAGAMITPWFQIGPLDRLASGTAGLAESSAGLAVTAVLTGVALVIHDRRLVDRCGWAPVCVAALAVVGGALVAPSVLLTLAVILVSAAAALVAAAWTRVSPTVRAASFAGAIALVLTATGLAPSSAAVWLTATLVGVLVLAAARTLAGTGRVPGRSPSAVVSSTATVLVLLAAGGVAPLWVRRMDLVEHNAPEPFGVALMAAAILVALAAVGGRATAVEARVVGWVAAITLGGGWCAVWLMRSNAADAGWRIAILTAVLASAASWSTPSRAVAVRVLAAAIAVPTSIVLAAELTVLVDGSTAGLGALAAATALAIESAVAAVRLRRPDLRTTSVALTLDITLLLTTGAVLLVVMADDAGSIGPLVLLVLAVAPTLVAFRPAPPGSHRRQLGWVGAALAIAALWWFLVDRSIETVEYYSLPVAGLLLVVATISSLSVARSATRASVPMRRLAGTEAVFMGAAAIAVLPSVALAAEGGPLRAHVTSGSGLALLLVALFAVRDTATVRGRSIAWFTGTVALAAPVVVRTIGSAGVDWDVGTPGAGATADVHALWWLAIVVVILLGAAVAVSRIRSSDLLASAATTASSVAVATAVAAVVNRDGIDVVMAVPWLMVLCATAVVTSTRTDRFSSAAAIISTVAAVALSAVMTAEAPHVELVTVPLGSAAVLAGAWRLRRDASARSWPMLAPGLLLLLIPSLAHDFGDTTLWRVIAVGVVAVIALLLGIRLRLQAPLVIGAATAVTHGLAQLWPWISGLYDAGYWWLWAGIGGVILIVFAARYEQRMKNLRDAGRALSALR
jgi:hypothetical protein